MKQRIFAVTVVLLGLTIFAACGDDEDETPVVAPAAASQEVDFEAPSTLTNAHPDFSYDAATWQGYWLSRDDFGPFVMASGMGIPFEPPMETMMGAVQMIALNPADTVMIPQNLFPLQAIFASGSPKLVNDPREFDPMDFEGLRLDPATFDTTVRVRGQAETMLKETQWTFNFATEHFGLLDDDYGAQQRFTGMMVGMLAQMQGMYAMQNLLADDGLYHDSDGALDYTANWVMLQVLSDIAGITSGTTGDSRYADPDGAMMFDGAATMLYEALASRTPGSNIEATAAIRALTFRAWTTSDQALRSASLGRARKIADDILLGTDASDLVQGFAAISGLISVDSVQDDGRYRAKASALFNELKGDFDPANGVFRSRSVYTADDVAWILGGLNALVLEGESAVLFDAERTFTAFFESTLDLSGMQLSAPPGKNGAMIGEFEKDLPHVVYYHGADTPPPPMVGMLTVPAREITWDGGAWKVTDATFETAGAMHLANELNWIGPHLGAQIFPAIPQG